MKIPKFKKHDILSEILPYDAIANDCILSLRKKMLTAILELHVSVLEHEDIMQVKHDRMMKLLCDFPDNSTAAIYYCKNFMPQKIPVLGQHKNEIINYIETKRISRLESINACTYQCFLAITMPLEEKKDSKGGIELLDKFNNSGASKNEEAERKAFKELIVKGTERLAVLIKGFCGAIGGGAYRLDSSQITQFLSLLLNHKYLDRYSELAGVLQSDIVASINGLTKADAGGYVYYGGNYHAALSLRSYGKESCLPEMSSPTLNFAFFHRDIQHLPYIVMHTIKIMSRVQGLGIAKGRRGRIAVQSGLSKNLSFLAKTPEGVTPEVLKEQINEAIVNVETGGHRFIIQQFMVYLWADSLKLLDDACITFQTAVAVSYKLKREKYNVKGAYYGMFPGNESVNSINTMLPSYNAGDFMPIDLPRFCYPAAKSKNFIYYHTKEEQLTRIDLFDRRSDNWNSIICGAAGSGKSFLCNDILFQYAVYNPQIAIIDYGGAEAGSYRNFIINNNGTYLEINLDNKDFSINPFVGKFFNEDGSPEAWKTVSLLATIERMAAGPQGDRLNPQTRYHLNEELKKYYCEKNNNADNCCNISEFAESHLKDNPCFHGNEDIYKRIFSFIGTGSTEGPYARFFKQTVGVTQKDFICFDLAGLKGHQVLKAVLIPALLDMINSNILGSAEKDRKKLLIMDEAWQDLKGGAMRDFMEEMYRTIRKLNGQITIITQRFDDIIGSDIAGALLTNTSYFYFVGNKHDPAPLHHATASSANGTMRLSDYDITTIIDSQSKRDFFLLTPFFSGLLKFFPSQEFAMVATTDPEDKNILRRHMEKLGTKFVTPDVIESAKHDFFNR